MDSPPPPLQTLCAEVGLDPLLSILSTTDFSHRSHHSSHDFSRHLSRWSSNQSPQCTFHKVPHEIPRNLFCQRRHVTRRSSTPSTSQHGGGMEGMNPGMY